MPLSSASTDAEVHAAYEDNLSYDLDGDATKAQSFIIAARFLLRRGVTELQQGDRRVRLDPEIIERQLQLAEAWWNTQRGSRSAGQVRYLGVSADFRG